MNAPNGIDKTQVAVVGGGIAGLTAAWVLLQRGFEVTLFEERVHLGGKLGAHPARIPFQRRRTEWDEHTCKRLAGIIDLSSGAFQKHQELILRYQLGRTEVPEWLLELVAFHFSRVARRLGLPKLSDPQLRTYILSALQSSGKPKVEPSGDLHGALDRWIVRYPSIKIPPLELPFDIAFCVAIYEREDGSPVLEVTDAVYHGHCYHMFLNWYHNFWALMQQIGLDRCTAFRSMDELVHLFPGTGPLHRRSHTLTSPASLSHAGQNLLSGAASLPDMLLWLYSMADLISQDLDPARYLDRRSVHAFLGSRWYATDESVRFHEHLLAKAFAVPTYFSSAYTYRKYVEYTVADPDPMLWLLKGDSYAKLFKIFEERLQDAGLKILRGTRVTGISWDADRVRIKYRPADMRGWPRDSETGRRSDDDDRNGPLASDDDARLSVFSPDYVVVAVPPAALAHISGDFRDAVPGLATVRKLQSAVTAALDLHFRCKLPGIPGCHVILRESALGLTFVDNSQAWYGDPEVPHQLPDGSQQSYRGLPTHLTVAVTDFYKIDGMGKVEATTAILEDLRRFIEFRDEDIDFTRTYLQMNSAEPLFINEVGSEPWRPASTTEMSRLFLAGDFCDNDIGIVSVEGAVVSGLLAARALQARLHADNPCMSALDRRLREIPVQLPATEPGLNAEAFKALLLPHVAVAYAASKQAEFARHPERMITPRDLAFHLEQALHGAAAGPSAAARMLGRAAQWLADLHARGR